MSKVEQIIKTLTELASDQEAKDANLECMFIAASKVENKLAFNFNLDTPELAMLLYDITTRSQEFKLAIQAVNAQIDEDNERKMSQVIKLPIVKNKITS